MKRKKVLLKEKLSDVVFSDSKIRISKESNKWFFEIGKESTDDISEGVSLLMRYASEESPVWDLKINKDDLEDIDPSKALFWLSGGTNEWLEQENYNRPWVETYLDFQKEFGCLIISIIKKSENLKDIRDGFMKYLNLSILYEFALSKELIK